MRHRLVSEVGPETRVARTYDARGLLVGTEHVEDDTRTVRSFTYDGAGLLGSVRTTSDDRDDDDDDDDGPGPTTETRLHWSSDSGLAQVLSMTEGGDTTNFLYGYGRAVAFGNMGAEVFSRDVFGSAVRTRETAPWVQDERYDVFGASLGDSDDDEDADAGGLPRFGFRGDLHLGDDIYLRARFYQPELGRFTTRDPLEVQMAAPAMANPYVFARNDPVNFVDPEGLRASSGSAEPTAGCENSQTLTPDGGAAKVPKDTGARGRRCTFKHVKTGIGTIRTDVYIPEKYLGPGNKGYGDGRKSNPKASWWQNRVTVDVNFNKGEGSVTFSPSCVDAPFARLRTGWYRSAFGVLVPYAEIQHGFEKRCVTALGISKHPTDDIFYPNYLTFFESGNAVTIKKDKVGKLQRVDVDAQDSIPVANLFLGAIDFCITYIQNPVNVSLINDKYPRYETYLNSKDPPIDFSERTVVGALHQNAC